VRRRGSVTATQQNAAIQPQAESPGAPSVQRVADIRDPSPRAQTLDEGLGRVIDAWPGLPRNARAAILAIISTDDAWESAGSGWMGCGGLSWFSDARGGWQPMSGSRCELFSRGGQAWKLPRAANRTITRPPSWFPSPGQLRQRPRRRSAAAYAGKRSCLRPTSVLPRASVPIVVWSSSSTPNKNLCRYTGFVCVTPRSLRPSVVLGQCSTDDMMRTFSPQFSIPSRRQII